MPRSSRPPVGLLHPARGLREAIVSLPPLPSPHSLSPAIPSSLHPSPPSLPLASREAIALLQAFGLRRPSPCASERHSPSLSSSGLQRGFASDRPVATIWYRSPAFLSCGIRVDHYIRDFI